MKPRRMRPRVMWACVRDNGSIVGVVDTRAEARDFCRENDGAYRVVRVRVTEAP